MKTTRAVTRAVAFAAALVMSALMFAPTMAEADVNNGAYTSIQIFSTCTYASNQIYTTGYSGSNITFQSNVYQDGPTGCVDTNWQAIPYGLYTIQDIEWSPDNSAYYVCNYGPVVQSGNQYQHGLTTSWWVSNMLYACPYSPGHGYVRVLTFAYSYNVTTSAWEGGYIYSPAQCIKNNQGGGC